MGNRRKRTEPLEREYEIVDRGANCSIATGKSEQEERTVRKVLESLLENLRKRSESFERD